MLLTIDTSTAWSGVCLYDRASARVLAESVWRSGTAHCEQLLPTVESLLRQQGLAPTDLTAVAVANGPGTFNGVRVGVATAKLIAYGRAIPIVAIETLAIYVWAVRGWSGLVRPILSATRGEIVTGLWRGGQAPVQIEPTRIAPFAEICIAPAEPTLYIGELTEVWRAALAELGPFARVASPAEAVRRPAALAEAAQVRLAQDDVDDSATLVPRYVRPPHITQPRR